MPKISKHGGPTNKAAVVAAGWSGDEESPVERGEVPRADAGGGDPPAAPAPVGELGPELVDVAEGTVVEPVGGGRPKARDDKSVWVDYAVDRLGVDRAVAEGLSKARLIDTVKAVEDGSAAVNGDGTVTFTVVEA